MSHCSNRVTANPAERTYSQSTPTEPSWKTAEKTVTAVRKVLNTNPTSSFTPLRNVAAYISLSGLKGDDWLAIAEQGALMNSSKPYPDWLSLPMTNCLKHKNIISSHTQTLGRFSTYLFSSWKIPLLPTRYAPNHILGPWFHSMRKTLIENPFFLTSCACTQPCATTPDW